MPSLLPGLALPKAEGATDVVFSAEFSTDLSLWVGTGLTITENGATEFTVLIDATPGPGAPAEFIRPIITLAP